MPYKLTIIKNNKQAYLISDNTKIVERYDIVYLNGKFTNRIKRALVKYSITDIEITDELPKNIV
jgi:hypothetical protein